MLSITNRITDKVQSLTEIMNNLKWCNETLNKYEDLLCVHNQTLVEKLKELDKYKNPDCSSQNCKNGSCYFDGTENKCAEITPIHCRCGYYGRFCENKRKVWIFWKLYCGYGFTGDNFEAEITHIHCRCGYHGRFCENKRNPWIFWKLYCGYGCGCGY